jgi:hypothetical protein
MRRWLRNQPYRQLSGEAKQITERLDRTAIGRMLEYLLETVTTFHGYAVKPGFNEYGKLIHSAAKGIRHPRLRVHVSRPTAPSG